MGIHLRAPPPAGSHPLALNRVGSTGWTNPEGPSQKRRGRCPSLLRGDTRGVLDHRRPPALRRAPAGRQHLRPNTVLENHSRAISSQVGSFAARISHLTPLCPLLGGGALRLSRSHRRHRRRGQIFRANQPLSIYKALNIDKEEIEIERGRPWQCSYIQCSMFVHRETTCETTFNTSSAGWPTGTSQGPRELARELVAIHES